MKLIAFIAILSCANQESVETPEPKEEYAYREIESSSPDSLDRTIEAARQMNEDLEKMNQNLDAIFRAVTDCKTDEECELLKDELAKEQLKKCQ